MNELIAICSTVVGENVKHLRTLETTIDIGCTACWTQHGLVTLLCHAYLPFEKRNVYALSVFGDYVDYAEQSPTHPERCAPCSLRTMVSAPTFNGDNVKYIWYVLAHLQRSTSRRSQLTTSSRRTLRRLDMGEQHAYCGTPLTWKWKETCNMLTYVREDYTYIQYDNSSIRCLYLLLPSRNDMLDAELYYIIVNCCATEKTTKMGQIPWTLPPHLGWDI